jgi:ribosomal protein L3
MIDLPSLWNVWYIIDAGRGKGVAKFSMSLSRHSSRAGPVHTLRVAEAGGLGPSAVPLRLKMPGHYGDETVSVLNIKVRRVDAEKHPPASLLFLLLTKKEPSTRSRVCLLTRGCPSAT